MTIALALEWLTEAAAQLEVHVTGRVKTDTAQSSSFVRSASTRSRRTAMPIRRNLATVALLVAACAFVAPRAGAQSSWDRYLPRSLTQVRAEVEQHLRAGLDTTSIGYLLAESDFPTRAKVTYTGSWRSVSESSRGTIESFVSATKLDAQVVNLFREEALFREGDAELWIPVQQQMAAKLRQEARAGQEMTIFVMWVGAFQQGTTLQSVFVANEFVVSGFIREIDIGTHGKITLGRPLTQRRAILGPPNGNLHPLRPGTFGGAESIAVELTDAGVVKAIHFGYAPGTDFDEYLANSAQVYGVPASRTTHDVAGGKVELVTWHDEQTLTELEHEVIDGASRVRLRLVDRTLSGR